MPGKKIEKQFGFSHQLLVEGLKPHFGGELLVTDINVGAINRLAKDWYYFWFYILEIYK